MISPLQYTGTISPEALLDNMRRSVEGAQRDITNLQRRVGLPMGDTLGDAGVGSGSGFDWATLTATLSRGGTATATLSDGGPITVNDGGSQIPGTIAIPSGKKVLVGQNAAGDWILAAAPTWCLIIRGTTPGSAITAGNTGSVVLANSMGTVTVRNIWSTSTPTSRVCHVRWNELEATPEWEMMGEDC